MVPHLVRDHVGLRKITRCTQLVLQRLVEHQVDIDLLVARAVERPHGALPGAAGGRGGAAKQHQSRLLVGLAALGGTRPSTHPRYRPARSRRISPCGRRPAGAARVPACTCSMPPPPLSMLRIVIGLMPKIQPPSSAMTMVPMPMPRPPSIPPGSATPTASATVFDIVRFPVAFPFHACVLSAPRSANRGKFAGMLTVPPPKSERAPPVC
jgi:hypothetical protein